MVSKNKMYETGNVKEAYKNKRARESDIRRVPTIRETLENVAREYVPKGLCCDD